MHNLQAPLSPSVTHTDKYTPTNIKEGLDTGQDISATDWKEKKKRGKGLLLLLLLLNTWDTFQLQCRAGGGAAGNTCIFKSRAVFCGSLAMGKINSVCYLLWHC